ncbi:ESX-1 secretion-associated protein EspB [Mycobacterium marinum]|uniref:PPE domain-containing protein n=1 Tax=Mycobacterium marinum TaxID=1781 RepID=UPI00045FE3FA|nr:hypothetical protein [Mycobacterium marinum]RFZ14738.1 ESX-1 secretion-associated protein EspB [Mycobacterium marinum]RFZ51265.1 ESX-1 secretion-associated protein EspB [Mycobacterium marinum]CDM75444.1 conserved hypothetical alanine and glycine rich protein [Mycobacterium marinum E11]
MTLAQVLAVEGEELLARAARLEAPIPGLPTEDPQPPCDFAPAKEAAAELARSAGEMRKYLGYFDTERARLAQSLRNAAKAYEEVDEHAAADLDTGSASVSAATPGPAGAEPETEAFDDAGVSTMAADHRLDGYADLKVRALTIEWADNGNSFENFARTWLDYRLKLLEATDRFGPFQRWDGEAAAAVEDHFDRQIAWLRQMADLCSTMASQAQTVAAAQRQLHASHIQFQGKTVRFADLRDLDDLYCSVPKADVTNMRNQILAIYAVLQQTSDEELAEYERAANFPLPPVHPTKPPKANEVKIDPPTQAKPPEQIVVPPGPDPVPAPADDWPVDEALPNPTDMPVVPFAGSPQLPGNTLADSFAGRGGGTGLSAGAPKLKPASFGGAGAASMRPPIGPDSISSQLGGRDLLGAGAAPGAAMGSGGAGMAPMGAPGAGQAPGQTGKGKRAEPGDELLYTEERPWTEGLIGKRPRKSAAEVAGPDASAAPDSKAGPDRVAGSNSKDSK